MGTLLRLVFVCLIFLPFFGLNSSPSEKRSFQVVAYNVQNLFDCDGVSLYDDYKPDYYGPTELANKLEILCKVLKRIGGEKGPEVLLLQEIEVDRTPDAHPSAVDALIAKLTEEGLGPYEFRRGYDPKKPIEKWPAVQCLTLSKFPITASKLHPISMARPILETTIEIKGTSLTLFNNHWKSGASSPEMETHRLQNATILRKRIDELVARHPNADFLVGGDLNSHYNHSTVYSESMKKTGINHVLGSTGKEHSSGMKPGGLYNLWHEVAPQERGSDAWRGNWGTLMHILLPASLYDQKGISYVDDSFRIAKFPGLNCVEGAGTPMEWSNELDGFGASDHFPLVARFSKTGFSKGAEEDRSSLQQVEGSLRKVNFSQALLKANKWGPHSLVPANFGKVFVFSGVVSRSRPITLTAQGHRLGLYSFDPETRKILFSRKKGESLAGYGRLSRYRGQWQFIIENTDWLK